MQVCVDGWLCLMLPQIEFCFGRLPSFIGSLVAARWASKVSVHQLEPQSNAPGAGTIRHSIQLVVQLYVDAAFFGCVL